MAASRPTNKSPGPKAPYPTPRQHHNYNKTISEETEERETLEPAMEDTGHMKFVDGRCSCCPYGYHIDLDFLHYLDVHGNVSYLSNLKKIHHNKKKLRKSMEVFLQQQDRAMNEENAQSGGPPPDVVHSTENFMNMVEFEDTATNKILEEIDTSVNATMDGMLHSENNNQSVSLRNDNADGRADDQNYRTEAELLLSEPRYGKSIHSDSCSSLDSTFSSDHSSSMNSKYTTTTSTSTHQYMTSAQLADNMASLLPAENGTLDSSSSTMTTISQTSLQAIREQMAMSLHRMRELEEQVKAMPVMQVRISVLKEEKHLLGLQLKAKSKKMNTRSIGVGDAPIEGAVSSFYDPDGRVASRYRSFTSSMWNTLSQSGRQQRPYMRTVGVGDGNVWENYQLQREDSGSGSSRIHEREIHSEQSTHVHEKEVKTVFLGQSENANLALPVRKVPPPVPKKPAKPTRSIGVGDSNVFDPKSNIHVHEKELRTVFIGNEMDDKPATRNVGVLCRPVMRDVGVTYMYENEMPNTRSIAVGVNEMGVGEDNGQMVLGESDGLGGSSSSSVTTVHNTMQQMNMAAFHTRHIHIKEELLKAVLDEKLRKDVRSVGVSTRLPTRDVGINHTQMTGSRYDKACGDDSVDVEVRPITQKRSVAIDHRPQVMNRLMNTDKPHLMEMATNTTSQMIHVHRATNTRPVVSYPASTNTTSPLTHAATTETEMKIFQALDQVRNAAVNTTLEQKTDKSMNTDLHRDSIKEKVRCLNKLTNTEKQIQDTIDKGVNTQPGKQYDVGVNTEARRTRERGNITDKVFTRNSSTVTNKVQTTSIGVGEAVLDPPDTSVATTEESRHKVDCDICLVKPKTTSMQHATTLTSPTSSEFRTVTTTTSVPTQSYTKYQINSDAKNTDDDDVQQSSCFSSPTSTEFRSVRTTSSLRPTEDYNNLRTVTSDTNNTTSIDVQRSTTDTSPTSTEFKTVTTTSSVKPIRSYHDQYEVTSDSKTKKSVDFVRSVQGLGSVRITPMSTGIGNSPVMKRYDENTESEDSEVTEAGHQSVPEDVDSALDSLQALAERETKKSTESSFSQSGGNTTNTTTNVTRSYAVRSRSNAPMHSLQNKKRTEMNREMSDMLVDTKSGEEDAEQTDSSGHLLSTDGSGTHMRVIRHVETTYVGGRPVKESSNVVMHGDGDSDEQVEVTDDGITRTTKRMQKGDHGHSLTTETVTETVVSKHGSMQDSGITVDDADREAALRAHSDDQVEYVESMEQRGRGRRVVVTETRIERQAPLEQDDEHGELDTSQNGTLKSIMKQPGSSNGLKKEISFCDEVVGGYLTNSSESESGSEEEEDDDDEEEDFEEEGSEGSQSSISYEEGSYDGTLGKIEYSCKDDETIAQGAPGAKMFDQNIRETFELTNDMQTACDVYAQWLEDSTMVNTKQLNFSLNMIQQEWFKASGNKLSNPSMVEDYLNSFNEMSHDLLKHVVNMADANGNTALHYAVSHCNTEIISLLLDTQQIDVNKQNKAGYTAIMLASLAQIQTDRQRDVIQRLFGMADLNAKASQAGQTALMLAVSHGRTDMVRMLLQAGADVNTQDEDGSTALMCASEHGHTDIVKMLLAYPESDAALCDNDGSTAMSIAMEAGHRDIGVLLYAHVNFKPGSPVFSKGRSKRRSTSSLSSLSSGSGSPTSSSFSVTTSSFRR